MPPIAEYQNLITHSKHANATDQKIKRLIFQITHNTLTEHYGSNYSTRCFQSSLIINTLLNELGISSTIVLGATCMPQVKGVNPYDLSWSGFWDKDHHIWLMSEFFEIIDLTISQIHIHPVNNTENAHPIPPFWWSPTDYLPSIISYLPAGQQVALDSEDIKEYELAKKAAVKSLHTHLNGSNTIEIAFNNILHGPESLNALFSAGDHWARGGLIMDQTKVPKPDWILNRQKVLLADY